MLVDLAEKSGLPIALDLDTGELQATGDVDLGERGERRLPNCAKFSPNPERRPTTAFVIARTGVSARPPIARSWNSTVSGMT